MNATTILGSPIEPTVGESIFGVLGVAIIFFIVALALGFILWSIRRPRLSRKGDSQAEQHESPQVK